MTNWRDKLGEEYDAKFTENNKVIRERNALLAEANRLQIVIEQNDAELAEMRRAMEAK